MQTVVTFYKIEFNILKIAPQREVLVALYVVRIYISINNTNFNIWY